MSCARGQSVFSMIAPAPLQSNHKRHCHSKTKKKHEHILHFNNCCHRKFELTCSDICCRHFGNVVTVVFCPPVQTALSFRPAIKVAKFNFMKCEKKIDLIFCGCFRIVSRSFMLALCLIASARKIKKHANLSARSYRAYRLQHANSLIHPLRAKF